MFAGIRVVDVDVGFDLTVDLGLSGYDIRWLEIRKVGIFGDGREDITAGGFYFDDGCQADALGALGEGGDGISTLNFGELLAFH